jgi:hypothetical protein
MDPCLSTINGVMDLCLSTINGVIVLCLSTIKFVKLSDNNTTYTNPIIRVINSDLYYIIKLFIVDKQRSITPFIVDKQGSIRPFIVDKLNVDTSESKITDCQDTPAPWRMTSFGKWECAKYS